MVGVDKRTKDNIIGIWTSIYRSKALVTAFSFLLLCSRVIRDEMTVPYPKCVMELV